MLTVIVAEDFVGSDKAGAGGSVALRAMAEGAALLVERCSAVGGCFVGCGAETEEAARGCGALFRGHILKWRARLGAVLVADLTPGLSFLAECNCRDSHEGY